LIEYIGIHDSIDGMQDSFDGIQDRTVASTCDCRSLCTGSAFAGARRCRCRRSLALASPSQVLTDGAAAAIFTLTSPSLMLADASTAAFSTHIPLLQVLAHGAAAAVFTHASVAAGACRCCCRRILYTGFSPSLVFADAAAAAVYTLAPLPPVFADATAAAVYTLVPLIPFTTSFARS